MHPGGIRTHNPNKRGAADVRHRQRGHWHRHIMRLVGVIKEAFDLFGSSVNHDFENKMYGIDMYICIYDGNGKGKVKCTLVQALRLCTGRTAHRESRGIALLFQDQRH